MKNTKRKPNYYWTKENCHEEALKCETKNEFQKKYSSAVFTSRKRGWLDEICSHMIPKQKPSGYWTKENCHEVALKYKSRIEFHKKYGGAYSFAVRKGWLDEICSHMKQSRKPQGYWTEENIKKEALKYKSRSEFSDNCSGGYYVACKGGWLDEVCSHMKGRV